jgi:hypothetical protein
MILTILLLVCVVLFAVGISKQVSQDDCIIDGRFGYLVARIVGGVLGFLLLVGLISVNGDCYAKNARMISMKQNIEVYQQAAKNINGIAVVSPTAPGSMIGGIENMQQSQNPSELVKMAAQLQADLNIQIQYRKTMLQNPWSSWWFIQLPQGL